MEQRVYLNATINGIHTVSVISYYQPVMRWCNLNMFVTSALFEPFLAPALNLADDG